MIRVLVMFALAAGLAACQPGPDTGTRSSVAASFVPSVRPAVITQRSDLLGQWQLIDERGQRCFVTLLGFAGSEARHALEVMTHGLCPGDLDKVAGWMAGADELVLTERRGRPIGRLREEAGGNFLGTIMGDFGPVSVRLERRG